MDDVLITFVAIPSANVSNLAEAEMSMLKSVGSVSSENCKKSEKESLPRL